MLARLSALRASAAFYQCGGLHAPELYHRRLFAKRGVNTPVTISVHTFPSGINDAHDIVGPTFDGSPGITLNFLYSSGTYTFLPIYGINTSANAINNAGEIVGVGAFDFSSYVSFIYSGGTVTTFQDPLAVPGHTFANGLNNEGSIVGYYQDSASVAHGFLY